jgi:hypothetical protein
LLRMTVIASSCTFRWALNLLRLMNSRLRILVRYLGPSVGHRPRMFCPTMITDDITN